MSSPGTDSTPERPLFLRNRGFALYWCAHVLTNFAFQMQIVAVGWQVYDITRDPFDLGLVGLSQFAPALALVLVTGIVSDWFPRRGIMGVSLIVEAVCAGALLVLSRGGLGNALPIFGLLVLFGAARAFYQAARQSIVPNLVEPRDLPAAIALATTGGQVARIAGPMVGGLLYGVAPETAYGATLAFLLVAAVLTVLIPKPVQRTSRGKTTWETLSGGIRYIWSEKVVLGAVSLDMFAVLLGGATALLPVYARDILQVGPFGLGALRSAMAVGAIGVGGLLIFRPIRDHAGMKMFVAVIVFGLGTAVFAFSTVVWLSVAALILMGAADMISINVRASLIQLWTPDELRGRVNAVNSVFVGASNEIGEFRAEGLVVQ